MLASCVSAVDSGAGVTAVVAFAFVTSRKLEPALLATLRILVPPPLPFLSFADWVSVLVSS